MLNNLSIKYFHINIVGVNTKQTQIKYRYHEKNHFTAKYIHAT